MAATLITVTHTFKNPDGSAASGVVVFKLSQRITNGGTSYAPQVAVHAMLDATGKLSQQLPANNDPDTRPVTSTYTVILEINGMSGTEYGIVVPYTAPTHTVTLGTLLPVAMGSPTGAQTVTQHE